MKKTPAFAGAMVVAEVLRALHGGKRCEMIHAHLRNDDPPKIVLKGERYQNRVARSGYTKATTGEDCSPIQLPTTAIFANGSEADTRYVPQLCP